MLTIKGSNGNNNGRKVVSIGKRLSSKLPEANVTNTSAVNASGAAQNRSAMNQPVMAEAPAL